MKAHASQRRKLSQAVAELSSAAAQKVEAGEDVTQELRELEACQKLLAALPSATFHRIYPAALTATMCLIVASTTWTVRVPKTKIRLRVKTTTASMRLAAPLEWEGRWRVGGDVVRLHEFARLELPPELSSSEPLTNRAWLDIVGGSTQLTRLKIDQGALVSVTRSEFGNIEIATLNKAFQGEIQTAGSPRMSAGSAPGRSTLIQLANVEFAPPATVTFFNAGRPAVPARLRVNPSGQIKLSRVAIRGLSLSTETANAEQQPSFSSGIVEGTLTLSDTSEALTLDTGEPLAIGDAIGLISSLEMGPTGIQLSFDGEVRRLSVGVPGFERNLKPTLLEYLYAQKSFGFFWGVVTFLWGLIWSGRKLLSL